MTRPAWWFVLAMVGVVVCVVVCSTVLTALSVVVPTWFQAIAGAALVGAGVAWPTGTPSVTVAGPPPAVPAQAPPAL